MPPAGRRHADGLGHHHPRHPAAQPLHDTRRAGGAQGRRVFPRVDDSDDQANSYAAQVDYYTRYITAHDGWAFAGIYTDDGISGTSTKHREGFNQLISDALAGNLDLIVTKSVSRFARNTVDSLTTVRKLKDAGVEIFFEKENIWTLDAKGELLITIMNRPGESGDFDPWEGWSHVRENVNEVPGRVA